jgi:hypothetical protein
VDVVVFIDATRSPDTPGADIFFGVLLLAFGGVLVIFRRRLAEDVLFLPLVRREPTPGLRAVTRLSLVTVELLAAAVGLMSIGIGVSRPL